MSGQPFDFPLIRTRIFIYQFSHQFFCVTFLHREQISERAVNFHACAEFVYNFSTFFSLQSRDRYGYCIITCPWQTYEINQLFINCIEQNIKMFLDPASWNWWCFIYTQHIAGGDLALTATHRINPVPVLHPGHLVKTSLLMWLLRSALVWWRKSVSSFVWRRGESF